MPSAASNLKKLRANYGTKRRAVIAKKKLASVRQKPVTPLLDMFLQALSALYPLDTLCPSVTLSYLPDKQLYYASVCRYDAQEQETHRMAKLGNQQACMRVPKQVLCSMQAETPLLAIVALAEKWYARVKPMQQFATAMRGQQKGGQQ